MTSDFVPGNCAASSVQGTTWSLGVDGAEWCVVIADRRYLAEQVRNLRQQLGELNMWTENSDRQFPNDAVGLAEQRRELAELLLADDMSGGQGG